MGLSDLLRDEFTCLAPLTDAGSLDQSWTIIPTADHAKHFITLLQVYNLTPDKVTSVLNIRWVEQNRYSKLQKPCKAKEVTS